MRPELLQFGEQYKGKIDLVLLDTGQRDSPEYKKYASHMTSRYIPYTVLLDSQGNVLKTWTGYESASDLKKDIEAAISGK